MAIVVDDAGPDRGVEAVVDRVGGGRIRYVRNPANLGLAGNWNRCLELAEHEVVTLFHADDELRPNYVRSCSTRTDGTRTRSRSSPARSVIGPTGQDDFSFPDEMKRFSRPKATGGQIDVVGEPGLISLLRGQYIFCPSLSYKRVASPHADVSAAVAPGHRSRPARARAGRRRDACRRNRCRVLLPTPRCEPDRGAHRVARSLRRGVSASTTRSRRDADASVDMRRSDAHGARAVKLQLHVRYRSRAEPAATATGSRSARAWRCSETRRRGSGAQA